MQLDQSADWLTWDNTVPVVFLSARASGPVTQSVPTAKVRALRPRELAASGGAYVAGDLVVNIPAALLTVGENPKPGDQVFTADGTPYTVLEEQGGKRDQSGNPQTWRLVTRNLALAFDLRDTISIQRPGLTYDAPGGTMRGWPDHNQPGVTPGGSTPYLSIAAKVQPADKAEEEEHGVSGLREHYTIILDRQVLLTREDRVKVEAWRLGGVPVYLDIERVYDLGMIDQLPKLDCVRQL